MTKKTSKARVHVTLRKKKDQVPFVGGIFGTMEEAIVWARLVEAKEPNETWEEDFYWERDEWNIKVCMKPIAVNNTIATKH